jgi:hypothetical protein
MGLNLVSTESGVGDDAAMTGTCERSAVIGQRSEAPPKLGLVGHLIHLQEVQLPMETIVQKTLLLDVLQEHTAGR